MLFRSEIGKVAQVKSISMAINEILKQIDAYLELLHQARELLLTDKKRQSSTRTARPRRESRADLKELRIPARRQGSKANSSLREQTAGSVGSGRRATGSIRSKAPLLKSPDPDPTVATGSEETNSPSVVVKRLPPRRRPNFTRVRADRGLKSERGSIKTATALANVKGSKIIVISAEQARLERERLAKPVTVRPRSLGSRSTGRSAFEALFSR